MLGLAGTIDATRAELLRAVVRAPEVPYRARMKTLTELSVIGRRLLFGTMGAFACVACSEGDAPKAWNALSTCLAGKAAKEPVATRAQAIRAIQLANAPSSAAGAWPARCAPYADELFAALPTSGNGSVLKRKLSQRLGCNDEKGSCKLAGGSALLALTTELWDAAKDSQLSATEAAAGVPLPEAAPAPVLNANSWKSFSPKPMKLSGPAATGEGSAVVVLKATEGRMRPTACEISDGFSKIQCVVAHADVPELPAHSIEAVHGGGVFVAGLTEKGLVAYDVKTGAPSAVRGKSRRLVRDGVAIEPLAKEDVSAEAPAPGAKPAVKEEGFVAVELRDGKVVREHKLPNAAGEPIAVGRHVLLLNPTESATELHAKGVAGGRLMHEATLKGTFSGPLHTCRKGEQVAVAAYGARSGLSSAKATGGAGKTQFTIALFRDGAWSKAFEATLPFERGYESDLVCTTAGASLTWAQAVEGGSEVGRIDCTPEGCKSSQVKLPGVESKWWWTVAPLGDRTLLLWRSDLGETRLRAGALSDLANAKDTLVFDAPDFGGPTAGELSPLVGEDSALLVFRGEQPVALSVARDGAVRLLSP